MAGHVGPRCCVAPAVDARWFTSTALWPVGARTASPRSADGLAYRYRNGDAVAVDILAPDHLGERVLSKLNTSHGRTVQVPGARKALEHSCGFTASYGDREEVAFVPSLLAAISIN